MVTKKLGPQKLGLCRTVKEGYGLAIAGMGVRIVVRAWRRGERIMITASAPDELAIWPAERVEEEEGLLPGELRGSLIAPRPANQGLIDALRSQIEELTRQNVALVQRITSPQSEV